LAERLSRDVRGAERLAAPALGAAVDVQGLLPREVGDARRAEARVLGLEVERAKRRARRRERAQEHVRQRREDVKVLPVRQEVQEEEHDGEMEPVRGHADEVDRRRGEPEALERRGAEGPRRREHIEPERRSRRRDGRQLLRAVEEHLGRHERGDEAEDEVSFPRAREALGTGDEPAPQEAKRRERGEEDDDVLRETERRSGRGRGCEPRQVEIRLEPHPEERDRPEREDEERCEEGDVEQSRRELLAIEQPSLPEAEAQQRRDAVSDPVERPAPAQRRERREAAPHGDGEDTPTREEQCCGQRRSHRRARFRARAARRPSGSSRRAPVQVNC
jgi:hypothetical protein